MRKKLNARGDDGVVLDLKKQFTVQSVSISITQKLRSIFLSSFQLMTGENAI